MYYVLIQASTQIVLALCVQIHMCTCILHMHVVTPTETQYWGLTVEDDYAATPTYGHPHTLL